MATDLPAPRTILVVDDEAAVRRALTQALERAGYTVMATDNGRQALELLQDNAIDLVISDHHMPELSGIDLLKLVRVRHPHVVRIIITADKDPDTAVRSINESEVYRFIRKPWNDSDLRTIMHFGLRGRSPGTREAALALDGARRARSALAQRVAGRPGRHRERAASSRRGRAAKVLTVTPIPTRGHARRTPVP
jgi:DNA-binding NtrC family response regulator